MQMERKALTLAGTILEGFRRDDCAQTTAEYVAVTAAAVAIATVVGWLALGGAIEAGVTDISTMLTNFITSPP